MVDGLGDMRFTFDANPLPMWVFDVESLAILAVNDAAVEHYGYTRGQFTAMSITDPRPVEDAEAVRARVATQGEGVRAAGVWRHVRADGSLVFASVTSHDLMWQGRRGRLVAAVDVTDAVEAQRALRETEARFQSIVEASREGIVVIDDDGVISYANDRMGELMRCDADELLGCPVSDLVASKGSVLPAAVLRLVGESRPETLEVRLQRTDGTQLWALVSSAPLVPDDGGAPGSVVAMITDISRRKLLEEQLQQHALHDGLTGLPNRVLLVDRVAQHRLRHQTATVVVVDIDGFARVNQVIGHTGGDELLTSLAERLRALAPGGTVARLGGDRFAVLVSDRSTPEEALGWGRRCRDEIARPFTVDGNPIHVRAAVGVVCDLAEAGTGDLIRFAEAAVDHAKQTGSAEPVLFRDELSASIRHRFVMEADLWDALDRRELIVRYQPIVRLADGVTVGAEALLRWQHPERGLLSPGAFLPHAEESDLVCRIGEYVLREACAQAAAWQRETPESFYKVSVNVAPRQLTDPAFVEAVASVLAETGVTPALMQFEITEASVIADIGTALQTVRRLKALGVGLALDDFGTGYSSLAYLKRFPFDVVKIDKSFIDGLGRDAEDAAIIQAVVDLANALGMSVVAEGVETASQRGELARLGCDLGQGFLWREAVEPHEISRLRRIWTPPPTSVGTRPRDTGRRQDEAGAVIAAVSHELRQPLTVITGYASLLLDGAHDAPQAKQYAHAVARSAHAMGRIIDALMDTHDAELGMLSVVLRDTTLEALSGAVSEQASQYVGPDRELHLARVDNAFVLADEDRVVQVIGNLIVNADRYSPAGLPIQVRTTIEDGNPVIIVRDHGPGIADDDVAFVFRKFARLDNAKNGTGLGLYLSRAIARAHGGDLRYRHGTGGGAEFILQLPPSARTQTTPADHRRSTNPVQSSSCPVC